MQRPKGTKDIYGQTSEFWSFILNTLEEISFSFNFKKIEVPIFESKEVFVRSVGKTSDVVSKQMFYFNDKSNRQMVLRPEGTAGVIRAVVENKIYASPSPIKLFYIGPMFRYENPQKGRQRQFTQYGVEVLGEKSPYLDLEIILMASMILESFKIKYNLKINYLGSEATRNNWSKELVKYFLKYKKKLEPISIKRLIKNPIRILDDKLEAKKNFVKNAPNISKFYSNEDIEYLNKITSFLKNFAIPFELDHNLVRGFDYYTNTIFEFNSKNKNIGSQNTIIGGGRYNNLVKQFGGPNLSGIGFAIGLERLVNEIKESDFSNFFNYNSDIYVMNIDNSTIATALGIVYLLRKSGFKVAWNYKPFKIIKAFEKADKTKASYKIIVGNNEVKDGFVKVKFKSKQQKIKLEKLVDYIKKTSKGKYE